jgi:radical SAM protein (TIGR01212 family)
MGEERLPFLTFSHWLKERYGVPVRKISLNAGLGCPNKDGTISADGCLFCDANQSGADPQAVAGLSVRDQLRRQIERFLARQRQPHKFLAYLQAGSNTYGPLDRLREVYGQALDHPDVVSLAVSTRPDCAPDEILDLIAAVAGRRDVWIELGLQSAHDATLARLNRGHNFAQVADAATRLKAHGFLLCLHLILGLPGETRDDLLATIDRVNELPADAVKLHPLSITRGSALESQWRAAPFPLATEDEYAELAAAALGRLAPGTIVQRLAGAGRREVHIAPEWAGNVNRVKKLIVRRMQPLQDRPSP